MKIYTKTGDKGKTSLVGGKRVEKTDCRVEAYGTVDELMSNLAVVRDHAHDTELQKKIIVIQNRLMSIASHLASGDKETCDKMPAITEDDVLFLETEMDRMDEDIPALSHFILPGGHPLSSMIHVARSVCRRAERNALKISHFSDECPLSVKYLNRLSDYLFTLARFVLFRAGGFETPWEK
jgi:cob(I)alamin adenosyltransferase